MKEKKEKIIEKENTNNKETNNKKKKNKKKKGFTLIELLAVIVILGILMVVAIPAVTRYIDESKKKTYVSTVKSAVDTVRYGVTSGDSNYTVEDNKSKAFKFSSITTEKGKLTSPYGEFDDDYSFVYVKNRRGNYTYSVQAKVKNSTDYSIPLTNIDNLSNINAIKKENELEEPLVKLNSSGLPNQAYSIGNTITYKGSNWYVIKNSPASQDYVTLMKERVLTNKELGEYAYEDGFDTVQFSTNDSTEYATSKVKEAVESYMINNEMTDYLEAVPIEGVSYKIRLITVDEIITNLGWASGVGTKAEKAGNNVPTWVYSNFGENGQNLFAYWTMTPGVLQSAVYDVSKDGYVRDNGVLSTVFGIRPVINLKKSAID